jgi:drug/metabolite transporter (DMT)-like permease
VRTGFGFIISISLAKAAGIKLIYIGPPALWARSASGSIGMLCTFYALTHLPVSDAVTLTNTFPLWVAILSWPILGKRPDWQIWLAVAMGVGGVALMECPSLSGNKIAGIAAVVAALCTALSMIGLNRLRHLDSRAIVSHFSGVSTAVTFVWISCSPTGGSFKDLRDYRSAMLLAAVGTLGTISQIGITKAFSKGTPARTSIVSLTQIVFASLYDWLLWDRGFNVTKIVGILLVIAPTGWLLLKEETNES